MALFPKSLEQLVAPLAKTALKSRGLAGTQVLTHWSHIVGMELAAHCLPEKLSFPQGKKSGGTLTVSVRNGFATELQHMQPVILERINRYFGYPAVARLTISHSFPKASPAAPKPKKPAVNVDAAAAEAVADPALKIALQSLAKALSSQ